MSSSQMEENLSETTEDQELDGGDAARMVPLVESIRYRKRAQSAEKKAEGLAEQLAEANQKISQMSQDLGDLQVEQKLARKLGAAGATDLEAAVLVAKARIQGKTDADVDACVEQLRREKAFLFGESAQTVTSRKTAGAKDRARQTPTALVQSARKAARTGSRADLQHYMKLRRSLM
jgi:hypothetical protein